MPRLRSKCGAPVGVTSQTWVANAPHIHGMLVISPLLKGYRSYLTFRMSFYDTSTKVELVGRILGIICKILLHIVIP
jgi:hypothetical protein